MVCSGTGSRRSGSEGAALVGDDEGLGAVAAASHHEDAGNVSLDSCFAAKHLLSDLGVRQGKDSFSRQVSLWFDSSCLPGAVGAVLVAQTPPSVRREQSVSPEPSP